MEVLYSQDWYKSRARKPLDDDNTEEIKGECNFLYKEDESLLNIDPSNYPLFYEMVINNPCLLKKSKTQFLKKFWKKYSNPKNIEFRKSVIGKYLFWFDKEFIGVIDNIMDVSNYISEKNNRYLIQISNRCEKQFLNTIIQGTYVEEYNGFGNILDTFEVNTYLINSTIPKNKDTFLIGKYIVDCGCTCTSMANLDYWNFKDTNFIEYPPDYIFKSSYKEHQILEWNKHILNLLGLDILSEIKPTICKDEKTDKIIMILKNIDT